MRQTTNYLHYESGYLFIVVQDMKEKTHFKSADSTYCPKCKWWGQRHYHIRGTKKYEYFIHYGFFRRDGTFVISKLHHHYAWSCYIGRVNQMRVRY